MKNHNINIALRNGFELLKHLPRCQVIKQEKKMTFRCSILACHGSNPTIDNFKHVRFPGGVFLTNEA